MLQNNTTASNMRWKARDFITLAIFNIAMIIILSIAITVSSVFSDIGAFLGCYFGERLFKKHIQKARLV